MPSWPFFVPLCFKLPRRMILGTPDARSYMVVFVEPNWTRSPLPDRQQATQYLVLLSALDLALLELERPLFRYAKVGPDIIQMADEELILAGRAKARLGQALSAAQHAEGHLQIVGVGDWKPTSTRPAWNAEPRLAEENPLATA